MCETINMNKLLFKIKYFLFGYVKFKGSNNIKSIRGKLSMIQKITSIYLWSQFL